MRSPYGPRSARGRSRINGVNPADNDLAHPESKGNIQDGHDVRGGTPTSNPGPRLFQAQGTAFDPWDRARAECDRRLGRTNEPYKGYGPRAQAGGDGDPTLLPPTDCARVGGRPDGQLGEVRVTRRQLSVAEIRAGRASS